MMATATATDVEWWLLLLSSLSTIIALLFAFLFFKHKSKSTIITIADDASESSPETSSLPEGKYEVFLSFHGPDTRKEFADFLYHYLNDAGIRTFRDNEEIRKGGGIGTVILEAITESKIAIPIFSQGYASSKWCLLELAKMVKCKEKLGQKILPIFYDVEPTDVRHQTSTSYMNAFREHEKEFDEKTVQEWKKALQKVGKLKGWHLQNDTHGQQGLLVKKVFENVLMELKNNYMLMTDELIGIDHHIEEIMKLLHLDSSGVKIVGIHGMGGIGKTTIAKAMYNKLSEDLGDYSGFLEDVRETSQQHNGFVILQNQLVSSILKSEAYKINHVNAGIKTIKDRVCGKRVLIVLDDIGHESHVYDVIGRPDWYASGSRILVTTRDQKVLKVLKVDETYEVGEMNSYHSLQLFCNHAFRQNFAPKDYKTLSREIVSTAAGLPLALKIYGSLLFGETKEVWIGTLAQLKEIPNEEVQDKLKVSYNTLTYEQKQIYLDIACLFIGKDREIASYMWEDCKFYPASGINVLILRSLIKIDDSNQFRMHDQLRDLGREIVRHENIEEPEKRSRLWNCNDAEDVLLRRMGNDTIKALNLSKFESLTNDDFAGLSNLRFVDVSGISLAGDFRSLFMNLRWLQWNSCPRTSAPTNFHVKNLVILDLSYSTIADDWDGWNQIKVAGKLKVLNLTTCNQLCKTPNLSTFTNLERLIITACRSMTDIDPSIANLKKLKVLDLEYSSITKLPDNIGNLEEIEEINASDCDFKGDIPSNIGRLSSLRILRLGSTSITSLPTSISRLSSLETLDLKYCRELQSLPELPRSLTRIITTCSFPNLLNLVHLQELQLLHCQNLIIPEDIGKLTKLVILNIYESNISHLPMGICSLFQLRELKVSACRNFSCLEGLPSSLSILCLQICESLEKLPDLSSLKFLSELILSCSKLEEIKGLGYLESLINLRLTNCVMLSNVDGIDQLLSLKFLKIENCPSLKGLLDVGKLKKLRWLDITESQNLIGIQGLDKLKTLETLIISYCHSLLTVESFEDSLSLNCLILSDCTSLERLADLSKLKALNLLSLANCQSLAEVEGLGNLESCEHLNMGDCLSIVQLPDISKLQLLKQLILDDSQNLREITSLEGLRSLEMLNVSGCISLVSLPDLSNLKNLKDLLLNDCIKLTEIPGLEELASLNKLEMNGCELIEKLADLSSLWNLEKLYMARCVNLIEIRGIESLPCLTLLDISGCRLSEIVPDFPNMEIIR